MTKATPAMGQAASPTVDQPLVLLSTSGAVARVTLNRPRAINALSHEMVRLISAALDAWRNDDTVRTVVLDGAGERGLCAGGDIRAIYLDILAGGTASAAYWADEYRLNAAIADYPKPFVAFMDGLVMGGGVGLSAHASHRVVNESSVIGMPEVSIGFAPDVGGTFLLSRAPGELGTHVALTSARMSGADAIACGFADVFVPAGRRAEVLRRLSLGEQVEAVLGSSAEPGPPSELAAHRPWIDHCYAPDSVEQIVQRLSNAASPDANAAAAAIAALSPTALKVTLRALRLARADTDLAQSLRRELRVSVHSLTNPDFAEGIRAQVVDKDRNPVWKPAELAAVSAEDIDTFFGPLAAGELDLTPGRATV